MVNGEAKEKEKKGTQKFSVYALVQVKNPKQIAHILSSTMSFTFCLILIVCRVDVHSFIHSRPIIFCSLLCSIQSQQA